MASSTRPNRPSDRPTLAADPSTEAALAADDEIDGRYRIETLLGTGAMGAVYRARHVKVGRTVAIKVLAPEWAKHDTMPERFREEARAASAIGHPGIVDVLDAGSLPDGRPYLVMELLHGRSLAAVLGQDAPLEPQRACTILAQIARAIAAAHDAGIVHRDLKPENVMLCPSPDGERVKVLDFGIAHAVTPLRARLTIPGTVMGTPEYMAPEQVRGDEAAPAFDIYALGVIAYEALSGRVPIDGTTSVEIMAKKSLDASPSLASARPDLPGDLVAIVDGCLAREPGDRPAGARALADALDRARRNLSMAPAATAGSQRSRRGTRIFATAGVAALTVALAWIAVDRDTPAREPAAMRSEPAPEPVLAPLQNPTPSSPPTEAPRAEAPAVAVEPAKPSPVAKVRTSPEATPPPPTVASSAPRCPEVRKEAEHARGVQNWTHLLRWLEVRACFPAAERTRLRTKAYMELRNWARCAAVGKGSRDPEVMRMVELCEHRRG
jgi:serine/threonine protein kinase